MIVLDWIRFVLSVIFMTTGVLIFFTSVIGVYRLRYVLNRMHAAAMGDTLGVLMTLIGLILYTGLSFASLKIVCIILFFWLASPVSSHLIARFEITTNDQLGDYMTLYKGDDDGSL